MMRKHLTVLISLRETLRKKVAEYFSDDPEFLRILIASKVNVQCSAGPSLEDYLPVAHFGCSFKDRIYTDSL